jgi:hypothetical protein
VVDGEGEWNVNVWNPDGARGEIRTPDLLVRSQTLYPTELRAHAYQDRLPNGFKNAKFRGHCGLVQHLT